MRPLVALLLAMTPALAACASHGVASVPTTVLASGRVTQGGSIDPFVVQNGAGAHWRQFVAKTTGRYFTGATVGADKNIWFIDLNAAKIVKMGMGGSSLEYPMGAVGYDMVVGVDGAFWITTTGTTIIRETTKGLTTSYSTTDSQQYGTAALGPDGDVWFPETSHIGKITSKGVVTEYPYPDGQSLNTYGSVAAGPDGNVWFAQYSANAIADIVPTTGAIAEHAIPQNCLPAAVVVPSDKNIWFGCMATVGVVGKYDIGAGTFSFFNTGYGESGQYTMRYAAVGPDGNPWFASSSSGLIYEVGVKTGKVSHFVPPGSEQFPDSLVTGPDGNIWVVTVAAAGNVDVYIPHPMTVTPNSLSFASIGQQQSVTVAQSGTSSWLATSSNTGVATVAQGGNAAVFVVTAAGAGTCTVKIADAVGNFVNVGVTVL